jgi:hypothetical protein
MKHLMLMATLVVGVNALAQKYDPEKLSQEREIIQAQVGLHEGMLASEELEVSERERIQGELDKLNKSLLINDTKYDIYYKQKFLPISTKATTSEMIRFFRTSNSYFDALKVSSNNSNAMIHVSLQDQVK